MSNVNSCTQPHAENIWKPRKMLQSTIQRLPTIQNSANILGQQGNVTTIGVSEYISRAHGASKPYLRPWNQAQLPEPQINDKPWSPHKIWLTAAPHPCQLSPPRIPPPLTLPTHQIPLRQTNLYSLISCNIQGLNTKK